MRYECMLCGYVYDDAREAVPFAELPDTWTCPMCGAPKSQFRPLAEEPAPASAPTSTAVGPAQPAPHDGADKLLPLSAGQLAALCGNLARGCEKQCKPHESEQFAQLARYFAAQVPPVDNASLDALSAQLLRDADELYPAARAAATAAHDRGTLRVITWGERITRMLQYLVERYLEEGEALLATTQVWVCTVCGFIHVGDQAPQVCPVCKVPSWKFEKIERGNA